MPLIINNIIAPSVESFKMMQRQFDNLTKIVKILNDKSIAVNVEPAPLGGMRVTPVRGNIESIRIFPNQGDWVDYEMAVQAIFVRTPELVYSIYLTEGGVKNA